MARPAGEEAGREAVLVARGLAKRFPGVLALDRVDLTIGAGEIVALLGQNGAGKSTLIQIVAGVHGAGSYEGDIQLLGRPFRPASAAEAAAAGVALVPQEVSIVPELSVAENITLNDEPLRWGLIDVAARLRRARTALADFGLGGIDPAAAMGTLDLATQQLVVIARALARRAQLLILDEPTAALTEAESQWLFNRMRALRGRGVAIVFVSHRLAEVFSISDRIVVMRDGRIRGRHATAEVTRADIVAEMVGGTEAAERAATGAPGPVALELRGLGVRDAGGRSRVSGLDLTVRRGEIVGLFGLLGAGCIEVALAAYGAWSGAVEGEIRLDGRAVAVDGPDAAAALGMGLMAQDRRDCLIADQSVAENIAIASLGRLARHGFSDVALARRLVEDQAAALGIRAASVGAEVRTLSGGNQQKVQIARWLAAEARILIMIDPTRGVDVGARREIKRIWAGLAARGAAMLIASTDAEELVDVCDRVVVMARGSRVGELAGAALGEAALLRMATDG